MNSLTALQDYEQAVNELLAKAVINTEKAISWARIAWGGALVLFSFSAWERYGLLSVSVSVIPIIVFIVVSVYFIRILRTEKLPRWLTTVSVTMDCLVCFFGLFPVVLWPFAEYPGMINLIDLSGLLIPLFAAGFRLSVRVAVWGTCLTIVSYAILLSTDAVLNAHPHAMEWQSAVLFFMYILGCAALTVILARHTRNLVHKSALEAIRNTMAKQALSSVMQGHHDMRSVLTSATIGVELLSNQVRSSFKNDDAPLVEIAQKVQQDLARLQGSVGAIKNEAFGNLMHMKQKETVSFHQALSAVIGRLRNDYPEVRFETDEDETLHVVVAGGRIVLERILFNVLLNSCEGDGRQGASAIVIVAQRHHSQSTAAVRILDDGPGFSAKELNASKGGSLLSRKKDGSGLGLWTVRHLLGERQSTLQCANQPEGGAVVTFTLDIGTE